MIVYSIWTSWSHHIDEIGVVVTASVPINVFDTEHMFNLKCQCDIACNKQRQIRGFIYYTYLVATTCMFLFLIGEILHFICLYSREDLVSLNKCELDESCL